MLDPVYYRMSMISLGRMLFIESRDVPGGIENGSIGIYELLENIRLYVHGQENIIVILKLAFLALGACAWEPNAAWHIICPSLHFPSSSTDSALYYQKGTKV